MVKESDSQGSGNGVIMTLEEIISSILMNNSRMNVCIFRKANERSPRTEPKGSPEFLEPLPEELEIEEGDEVRLTVRVTGEPKPKVKWMMGSQPLKKSSRVEIFESDDVHEVLIKNVILNDEGVYNCVATNKFGEAFCDCELLVEGAYV